MSIELKIASILAESKQKRLDEAKLAGTEGGSKSTKENAQAGDQAVIRNGNAVPNGGKTPNPDNARNNVDNEKDAEVGPEGSANPKNGDQSPVCKGDAVKGMKEYYEFTQEEWESLSEEEQSEFESINEVSQKSLGSRAAKLSYHLATGDGDYSGANRKEVATSKKQVRVLKKSIAASHGKDTARRAFNAADDDFGHQYSSMSTSDDNKKAFIKKDLGGKKTKEYKLYKNHLDNHGMDEDLNAMFGADDLSEEFKTKAATIFEAAVMSRVTAEVTRLEEEFEAKVADTVAEEIEGIVEQVDGYLGYIAEQWMTQNEIALERGIKSDILESFVDGLKGLFEEHYIDVPEEKYDLLGEMEETISDLESKIDEQVAANVKLTKTVNEAKRSEIINTYSEGLTDTEAERFTGLVAEVAFDDTETYKTKVKTLRESYFTTKTTSGVQSVVTDTPVEVLTEAGSKKVDPKMSAYLSALNNK